MDNFKWSPIAVIVMLFFAGMIAIVVNEVAPWVSKSDMQAAVLLLKQNEAADMAMVTARLAMHDKEFDALNIRLTAIAESNGDIKQLLSQMNQKLEDFTDPNLPYIPEHKKKDR